jgi:hypothetical protein
VKSKRSRTRISASIVQQTHLPDRPKRLSRLTLRQVFVLGSLLDQILHLLFDLDWRSTRIPAPVPIGPCELLFDPGQHLEGALVGHDVRHLLGHVRVVSLACGCGGGHRRIGVSRSSVGSIVRLTGPRFVDRIQSPLLPPVPVHVHIRRTSNLFLFLYPAQPTNIGRFRPRKRSGGDETASKVEDDFGRFLFLATFGLDLVGCGSSSGRDRFRFRLVAFLIVRVVGWRAQGCS